MNERHYDYKDRIEKVFHKNRVHIQLHYTNNGFASI